MGNQQVLDPWARASDPQTGFTNEYWGQLKVDAWLCALVKGTGKVPFDPAVHDRPATALDMDIVTLPEMRITNSKITERKMIAESDEWASYGWASLKALGIQNLREAADKWVKVETVQIINKTTGLPETYEKNGQTKEKSTYKFLAIFADESACRADYLAHNPTATQAPTQAAPAPAPTNGNGGDPAKSAAAAFMKVIVTNIMKASVGKPLDEAMNEVAKALAQYPRVGKYFSVQSPEVVELMMTAVQ
jgi:hypothetical protein